MSGPLLGATCLPTVQVIIIRPGGTTCGPLDHGWAQSDISGGINV